MGKGKAWVDGVAPEAQNTPNGLEINNPFAKVSSPLGYLNPVLVLSNGIDVSMLSAINDKGYSFKAIADVIDLCFVSRTQSDTEVPVAKKENVETPIEPEGNGYPDLPPL
jgi:hypothetical protein